MTWNDRLKGDALSWLLEENDPGVRYLALRDLCDFQHDDPNLETARRQALQEGPIADILNAMNPEGWWAEPGPGYYPKYRSAIWSIILLAQLGARVDWDERIGRGCRYLLDKAFTAVGAISASGAPSGTADCMQGNICWALTKLGVNDPRLDQAFDWMARTVTGEGMAAQGDKNSPARYYAGKCGPNFACGSNNRLPCAWGGVKVMMAFGSYPKECRTPQIERAIQQGVEFFFSVDPADAAYPNGYSAKPTSDWWKFGFPVFYVSDILQIAEAMVNLGHGADPRLARTLDLIASKQDDQGRWALEYDYSGKTWVDFGAKKLPNKWVTLRALRVIKKSVELS